MPKEKQNNSSAMTLGDIIDKGTFIIPIYQRAYKWSSEECKKLVEDLVVSCNNESKKSLGLITLKDNQNDTFDVIDGQQRFITLAITSCLLDTNELIEKITFERDTNDGNERRNILYNVRNNIASDELAEFTDGDRMIRNTKSIKEAIKSEKLTWNFIKSNCVMLCSMVTNNPIEEFMNLNAYKTPFSICDHVRANLITLNTFHKDSLEKKQEILAYALGGHSYKTAVSKLYEDVVSLLYSTNLENGKYKSVYDVVKKNCTDVKDTKESRINIVFYQLLSELHNNMDGYRCNSLNLDVDGWIKELLWFSYINNLLIQLKTDLNNQDYYTAKLIDEYCGDKKNFFSLISKDIRNAEQTSNELVRILDNKNSIDNMIFGEFEADDFRKPNLFLEALVSSKENDSISKSYYSAKIAKIDEQMITDDIQCAGKYIISRFLSEQQNEKDSNFKLSPILDFEDKENPKFKDNTNPNNDVWTVGDLFNYNIKIPVIQRDYCMGTNITDTSGSEDFLEFILKSFNEKKELLASTIIIAISETEDLYIFDGQQRTYTIYQLLKYLGSENPSIKNYEFVGRDINASPKMPTNYIEESVTSFKKALEKRCADYDKTNLKDYITSKVTFNIKIITELSAAEQFFMDINGGVALVNYEIFKSCLIDKTKYTEENGQSKLDFARKIENEWLNFFYKLSQKIYGDTLENSEEELIEIRVLEFICRWLYRKKSNKEIQSFDNISSKSDLVHNSKFINEITIENICVIMNYIVKQLDDKENIKLAPVDFFQYAFEVNSYKEKTFIGFSSLRSDSTDEYIPFFLHRFLRSCSNKGRHIFFNNNHEEAINYYDNDMILSSIFEKALNNNNPICKSKCYQNTELPKPIHLLAGYNNWKNNCATKKFDSLTELELPIYYVDHFWNSISITTYRNMYRIYYDAKTNEDTNKHLIKTNNSGNAIALFLVMKNKTKLDTGAVFKNITLNSPYLYENGGAYGQYETTSSNKTQFILTKPSANVISLKSGEDSLIDK